MLWLIIHDIKCSRHVCRSPRHPVNPKTSTNNSRAAVEQHHQEAKLTPRWPTGEALPCQAGTCCIFLLTCPMTTNKGLLESSQQALSNKLAVMSIRQQMTAHQQLQCSPGTLQSRPVSTAWFSQLTQNHKMALAPPCSACCEDSKNALVDTICSVLNIKIYSPKHQPPWAPCCTMHAHAGCPTGCLASSLPSSQVTCGWQACHTLTSTHLRTTLHGA
jgi:hypothetical protein